MSNISKRVSVRKPVEADLELLLRHTKLGIPFKDPREWSREEILKSIHCSHAERNGLWVVEFDGKFAGTCFLKDYQIFDPPGQWRDFEECLSASIFLAPEFWGEKIGPEVLKRLIQSSRDQKKPILAEVDPNNERSLRVVNKFGFAKLGTLEEFVPLAKLANEHHWIFRLGLP